MRSKVTKVEFFQGNNLFLTQIVDDFVRVRLRYTQTGIKLRFQIFNRDSVQGELLAMPLIGSGITKIKVYHDLGMNESVVSLIDFEYSDTTEDVDVTKEFISIAMEFLINGGGN